MGYDLTNSSGEEHQWKSLGWWQLLNLAHHYGWSPAGTRRPHDHEKDAEWDGNYFHNAGQEITEIDARALGVALQQMLDDPHREEVVQEVTAQMQAVIDAESDPVAPAPLDLLHYPAEFARGMMSQFSQRNLSPWKFDDRRNAYLRDFIEFCRNGSFRIE